MMARPPAFSTAVAMISSSQATTTGPSWAASARRSTWTIIGRPAISASGLPGSRVEAIRAGMRMRTSSDIEVPWERGRDARLPTAKKRAGRPRSQEGGSLIRVARAEANGLFLHRNNAVIPPTLDLRDPVADGLFRIQQDRGRRPGNRLVPAGPEHHGRGDFRAPPSGKARFRNRRETPGRT